MADHRQWSFCGFFGFSFNNGFEDLGIVWGRGSPIAALSSVQVPAVKNLLGMGSSLQEKTKKAMSKTKPAEHSYLGDCVSTERPSSSASTFSSLDIIAGSSKICKLAFSASVGRLSGLKVEYSDDKQLIHRAYTQEHEVWNCEVKGPIIAAKLTVGKTISTPEPFIDTVEMGCGDKNGEIPL